MDIKWKIRASRDTERHAGTTSTPANYNGMKEQVKITEHAKKSKDEDCCLRVDLKTLDMDQRDVLSMVE